MERRTAEEHCVVSCKRHDIVSHGVGVGRHHAVAARAGHELDQRVDVGLARTAADALAAFIARLGGLALGDEEAHRLWWGHRACEPPTRRGEL